MSGALSKANITQKGKIAIMAVALGCYVIAFVIMNLPAVGIIPAIGSPIAMVLFALAIIFNFSGHDLLADKCSAKVFGYLGAISLPIYLLHTVVIRLFLAAAWNIPAWALIILVFVISIGLSVAIFEIIKAVKKAIVASKEKKSNQLQTND